MICREGKERSGVGRRFAGERRALRWRPAAFAVLAFALHSAAAWAQSPHWQNTWKTKDPSVLEHLLLEIGDVSREGFSVSFDEGIGAEGYRGAGKARFLSYSKAVTTLDVAGRPCELTLTLRGRGELVASGCALGVESGDTEYVMIPADAPRYFTTGFKCGRVRSAVLKLICSDRVLAGLDKSLSDSYGRLRVKLSKADQNRLRADQRDWLIGRDKECGAKTDSEDQARCLKRHYGARLFGLHAWRDYRVHVAGEPDFAAVREVAEAAQSAGKPVPNLLEMGLAAWLNRFISPALLETDSFERYEASANAGQVAVSGVLRANPTWKKNAPADDRRVILVYDAGKGLWFGDLQDAPVVYTRPGRSLADAPEELLAWLGGFSVEEITVRNVLP